MPKIIEFECPEENLIARAELLENLAPETCALIWKMLPVEGYFHHAYYSGAELAMILPDFFNVELEKPTTVILPWEIAFTSLRAHDYFDVDQDFSEILFFYDRNTGPKMLDGPAKVTIFARFLEGDAALRDQLRCLGYRMREEGQKHFIIRQVC